MLIFEIQKELEHGLNPVIAQAIENSSLRFEALKNEYKDLNSILKNQLKAKILIFLLLNAIEFKDLLFAKKLVEDFNYYSFNRDGAKLALARFYYLCKSFKKSEALFWELHLKNSIADIRDYESLYLSSNEIGNFKNCELIIKKCLEIYPNTLIWKLYAVSYKISISHLFRVNAAEVKNNLDYLSKRVKSNDELFILATSYYLAGYLNDSFHYFNKVFETIEIKENSLVKKDYFNVNDCYESMIDIVEILRKNNKMPFIAFGTLLGLIREGKILDHDKDADLGLFVTGYDEVYEIVSLLCKIEHFTAPGIIKNTKENNSFNIAIYDHRKGVAVDLFFFYKTSDNKKIYSGIGSKGANLLWEFNEFHLVEKEINNYKFLVPENFQFHLTELYNDWSKTVEVWDSLLNCPNIPQSSVNAVYFFGLQRMYKSITEGKILKARNYFYTLKNKWNFNFYNLSMINLESILNK
jgi:hypothetical protein